MPRWTRIREPAMQFWPAKVVTPAVRSGRVEASIASSNTIIGVLPPSSRFMRFSVLAPAAAISRPTSNTAGEADHVHIGRFDQKRRPGVARLGEHIDNAGRH